MAKTFARLAVILIFVMLAVAAGSGQPPSKDLAKIKDKSKTQDQAPKPAAKKTIPLAEPAYTMKMAGYTVEVGKDGFLNNLVTGSAAGQTQYVESFFFRATSLKVVDLSQTGKNEVEATFSAEDRKPGLAKKDPGEIIPDVLKVRYTFDDSEVRIAFKGKLPVDFTMRLGEDAQIVENLNNGDEAILPVNPPNKFAAPTFTSARFTYLNGSELVFRYDGPPHRFGFTGGMFRREYGRQACSANTDYSAILRVMPGKGAKVLAAPQFNIQCAAPGYVFFDGESPKFKLTFDAAEVAAALEKLGDVKVEQPRIEYLVTDHLGREIARGETPIDFEKDIEAVPDPLPKKKAAPAKKLIVKEVSLKIGQRGYFDAQFRVVDAKGVLRPVWAPRPFSVVEAIKSPEAEREFMGDWRGNDYIRNAFIGLGVVREPIGWDVHVAKGQFDFEKKKYDQKFTFAKEMREKTGVNNFWIIGDHTHPWAKTPQDMFECYEGILSRYKNDNHWWETLNEPNVYGVSPELYLEMYLKPLKLAAEKVDPQAKIIAPSMCGWAPEFVEELYKLGGKDYFDALSIHPYHGQPYDVLFEENFAKLRAIMTRYGDEKKPVWFTEAGFGWFNLKSRVANARANVRRILIQEQKDIPKEHDMYYYTSFMGYLKFYLIDADGSLFPQAVALRARKCRLDGTTFDRNFGFGLRFVHGNVYKAPDRQVVVLWSYDNHRTVELKTTAAKAQAFDMWGNPLRIELASGKLTVPVSGEPCYVVLAPDATVSPVLDAPVGRNVADLVMGAEASASSESSPAALALDGHWNQPGWRDNQPNVFPKWWQVDLAFPTTVDRVHIYTGNTLFDFNLMGFIEGKWTSLAEVRGTDDYVVDLKFAPVNVEKLRVDILAGQQNAGIYEFEAFAAAKDGTQSSLVNHALASAGATAKASSIWKMETEVPVIDKGESSSSKRAKVTIEYAAEHAIDGKFAPVTWQDYTQTVWIADGEGKLPQWLEIDFPRKQTIQTVLVFVNNFGYWKAAETGISDADLEAWDGNGWKPIGSIQGSKKGVLSYRLKTPVQTDKIRLMVKATNGNQPAAVMEFQAWGPPGVSGNN